ncbi:MAG: EAL domain-containing protein [Gammaproteobacteria bacterium]|nr:EAL domain-containing protein [Gammaproteobacteria bacterium]
MAPGHRSETGRERQQRLTAILEATPDLICIANLDDAILRMKELIHSGISFSLDDFGTGYSSLAHLKILPVNHIKIDRYPLQG